MKKLFQFLKNKLFGREKPVEFKAFLPNTSHFRKGKRKDFNEYGKDKSGKKVYHYNSLGYRGEEFDPNAKIRIYLCGCSHTHGTGLNWEETFGFVVKEHIAEFYNIDTEQVNLMNFSVGAASNAYIVRTLITQCNISKPDILISNFAHKKNLEFKSKKSNRPFCPSIRGNEIQNLDHPLFDDLNLFVETAKNMLLLQYYCRLKNIPYVFAWVDMHNMQKQLNQIRDTHRYIEEELDLNYFVNTSIRKVKVDLAADADIHGEKAHGGVETNKIYGKLIFDKYIKNYH